MVVFKAKKAAALAAILLIALTFLSGCTDSSFGGSSCSVIGNCKTDKKDVEVPDIIQITSAEVSPAPNGRVSPNSEVNIRVVLKNVNKDPDGSVTVSSFAVSNAHLLTCVDCTAKFNGKETFEMVPGQERAYIFKLKTPEIDAMAATVTPEIAVKYDYRSTRLVTLTYVKKETYLDYLNSGKKLTVTISDLASQGPVELNFDMTYISDQPLIYEEGGSGEEDSKSSRAVWLSVINKGSGEISEIAPDNLRVGFEDNKGKIVDCSETFRDGDIKDWGSWALNKQPIRVLSQNPQRYYFYFEPTDLDLEDKEFEIVRLFATADYTYRVKKQVEMTVSKLSPI
ncbi:MAG: hypothetical protein JW727_04350 [Candidatus Aenigmarchaeota archaeon]|nr:hypothetical protein [Candidatus Aenigmarchaeota archaeon]